MALDKNIKILIVDDTKTMRGIIVEILQHIGFTNISEAHDGTVGLAMIETALKELEPYDLIISDWNMPKMSGLDLLKRVREMPELGKLPFLMVTAESEKKHIVSAIEAGVSSYIVKPLSIQVLEAKIVKIMKQ